MRRTILSLVIVFILAGIACAQPPQDSIVNIPADSTVQQQDTIAVPDTKVPADVPLTDIPDDSVSVRPRPYFNWAYTPGMPILIQVLQRHPYFDFASKATGVPAGLKQFQGKEALFYVLVGLLLAFASLREAFPKYLSDLFRLLFRTTLKQKQIREQLIQTPLPSLLLNIFFFITVGMYINIMLQHFEAAPIDNFWLMHLYCSLGLAVIYVVKFFTLKFTGWLFNIKEAAETYIFVVFIINKVIGMFVLPFLVLLSFMQGTVFQVAMVLSWCGIGVLLIYRLLLTYASVRNQVKFNPFHFLLYLGAFEIAPLLLIYKALLFFFR
ncbi:MAG: DUF4271 domain-containing protein [Chitinophagaceae bacterium]|nr:DUF4271 domain-containing protein [Chitinophagaceae bacterium]